MIAVDDDDPIKTRAASKEYRDNWDRMFGEKPIYYAHPITLYNTEDEDADVAAIATLGPVLNPNAPEHEEGYQARRLSTGNGMDYFYEKVLPDCGGCAFRAFSDGKIGAGVFGELTWFAQRGLPVYEIAEGVLISQPNVAGRALSVDETRARIQQQRAQ